MIQCDSCEERFKAPTFYIMVIWAVMFENEGHKISHIFYQKSMYSTVSFVLCEWVLGHQKFGIILESNFKIDISEKCQKQNMGTEIFESQILSLFATLSIDKTQ